MSRTSEGSLIGLGLALVVFGGAVIWRAGSDATQLHVGAGIVVAGLLILPSIASLLASGVKQVGGACAEAWRSKGDPKP